VAGTDDPSGERTGSDDRSTGDEGSDDRSDIWVNPLDDEEPDSTDEPDDWARGIVDAASAPRDEARVRTSESGTVSGDEPVEDPETSGSDPEVTVGPIGLKGGSDGEEGTAETASTASSAEPPASREPSAPATTGSSSARASSGETSIDRREPRSTGTVAEREISGPPRTGTDEATEEAGFLDRVPWSISLTAIGVGVGLLVFLDIVSMMVPLIAAIGAGIVGGFVAGYISGGTVRGAMHALAVGIIGGVSVGYLTALVGALVGLFLEPATLLGRVVGPITPSLGIFRDWGPLLVMVPCDGHDRYRRDHRRWRRRDGPLDGRRGALGFHDQAEDQSHHRPVDQPADDRPQSEVIEHRELRGTPITGVSHSGTSRR
jgi:hypothetical protein